ncbi:MAG: DivIVA domain-containing protein [Clostridiales bacterium]|nr:DivIVA domain-containing protein [Clostridiales bacterium]
MITPLEIQNKKFRKSMRGYKEDEVDEFLDKIMVDYERLFNENAELKDKLEQMNNNIGKYKNIEETLTKTLIVAQNAAEELRSNSMKEAEMIIQEAKQKIRDMNVAANKEINKSQIEYEEIRKQMQIFKTRFKTLLEAQLELVLNNDIE